MRQIAALLMLAATTAAAEPNAVLYQLQERCGKRAEEVLARDFRQRDPLATIRSHYNGRLNKCFAIVSTVGSVVIGQRLLVLFDVNESKEYGGYQEDFCHVEEKHYHSEAEWNALVKPYMEE
jgi:hypothetical protein